MWMEMLVVVVWGREQRMVTAAERDAGAIMIVDATTDSRGSTGVLL